jgi:hypothetical protein
MNDSTGTLEVDTCLFLFVFDHNPGLIFVLMDFLCGVARAGPLDYSLTSGATLAVCCMLSITPTIPLCLNYLTRPLKDCSEEI